MELYICCKRTEEVPSVLIIRPAKKESHAQHSVNVNCCKQNKHVKEAAIPENLDMSETRLSVYIHYAVRWTHAKLGV